LSEERGAAVADPEAVEVTVRVAAPPAAVFGYLTDPARYVQWMGSEAVIEPVPGGAYAVRMADGFAAAGRFEEVDPPHRVTFSWGWADSGAARQVRHEQARSGASGLPAGSTRVTVTLDPGPDGGTRLVLRHHDLPTADLRDAHREAWQAYLARLAVRAGGGDPGPDPHG
jgi:uncharacterized protein YndB with AHSA1/START domain